MTVRRASREYDGPIIDSDMHHTWRSDDDIVAYLPKRWRDHVRLPRGGTVWLDAPIPTFPHIHGPNKRLDTYPPDGGPPGSDYETLKHQLLDQYEIERVLLSFDVGGNAALLNIELAGHLVRAINDWNVDHWLSIEDDRLRSAILVPMQDPGLAAEEIHRLADHPKIDEVLIVANGLRRPLGDPLYHPIYAAAVEVGLPVKIHAFGGDGPHITFAGGVPGSRLEFMSVSIPHTGQHYLTSLITHGVFEKYHELMLMIVEYGAAWAPWVIGALDAHYDILRAESVHVRRRPSEYFREHVRLTTQPIELTPKWQQLVEMYDAFGGMDDILCFATDYPHYDTDDPMYIAKRFPAEWLPKILYGNAAAFYGRQPAAVA
jgi:predicted TIM-barrel fold metal-dependent hydrolase